MRNRLKLGCIAAAVAATACVVATPAEGGGWFGISLGSGGFGLSVGVGDWGPYTSNWANPQWTLSFDTALSGYGEWVWVGGLGRVWKPWVAVDWRPYTYGRWVRTTLGWTWVAYEPWGYVPHHYGNWAMCDFGWVWVPGYSYTPANVVWVRGGGYVGWYARPPWGWSHAARSYRHGYRDGYRDGWEDARYATYVDWYHMSSDNVSHFAARHTVASRGGIQDHAAAPTVAEIQRHGGVPAPEARLSQRTISMDGRRVTVARPDGVAGNIERHAPETAATALAPRALALRQPSIRSNAAPAAGRSPGEGAASVRSPRSPSPAGTATGSILDRRDRNPEAVTNARSFDRSQPMSSRDSTRDRRPPTVERSLAEPRRSQPDTQAFTGRNGDAAGSSSGRVPARVSRGRDSVMSRPPAAGSPIRTGPGPDQSIRRSTAPSRGVSPPAGRAAAGSSVAPRQTEGPRGSTATGDRSSIGNVRRNAAPDRKVAGESNTQVIRRSRPSTKR